MRKIYLLGVTIILLAGCVSGHLTSYVAEDVEHLKSQLIYLDKGSEPKIYTSDNLFKDVKNAQFGGYVLIGSTSFKTSSKNEFGLTKQISLKAKAKMVKAVMVITSSEHLGTTYGSYSQYIPTSTTTHHSGRVTTDNGASGTYSGSSTTYGGEVVTHETKSSTYSQNAYFFAKDSKPKVRLGVSLRDLSDSERRTYQRNTGAMIILVGKNTPAFYANMVEGDLVVVVNGKDVRNTADAIDLISKNISSGKVEIEVLRRDGKQKRFTVSF